MSQDQPNNDILRLLEHIRSGTLLQQSTARAEEFRRIGNYGIGLRSPFLLNTSLFRDDLVNIVTGSLEENEELVINFKFVSLECSGVHKNYIEEENNHSHIMSMNKWIIKR